MIIFSKYILMNYNTEEFIDKGDLSLWRNELLSNGITLLYNYTGSDYNNTIYVPCTNTVINNWVNASASGTSDTNRNTPFYNNQNVISVDLQFTPFVNNNMSQAFYNCRNLTSVVNINQNVTSMGYTFSRCYNLNQNIQIPNSVTNMGYTFDNCQHLNQNIQIPNSVTYMYHTFSSCEKLSGRINILSTQISIAANCFYGCSNLNVAFPLRYINNVNSATRNSLVTAGYEIGTAQGNTVTNATQFTSFTAWDFVGGDYNTYTGNGTHWILSKWNGKMSGYPTDITVPNQIVGYNTAINYPCFSANTTITSVDCNFVTFTGTTCVNAFRGCTNLTAITYLNIPEGITSLASFAYNCQNLSSVTSNSHAQQDNTVVLTIPNTVTTLASAFAYCKNISNFNFDGGFGITSIASCFTYCNTRHLNVLLEAPNISNISGAFTGFNNSYRKNIYIYFNYANGVATKTFNSFKAAQYMGTSGNSTFANPSYNSTSNFYIYNLGTCPV